MYRTDVRVQVPYSALKKCLKYGIAGILVCDSFVIIVVNLRHYCDIKEKSASGDPEALFCENGSAIIDSGVNDPTFFFLRSAVFMVVLFCGTTISMSDLSKYKTVIDMSVQ